MFRSGQLVVLSPSSALDLTIGQKDPRGRTHIWDLFTVSPGTSLVNSLSILDTLTGGSPRPQVCCNATASDAGPTTLLRLEAETLRSVLQDSPEGLLQLVKSVARQYRRVNNVVYVHVLGGLKTANGYSRKDGPRKAKGSLEVDLALHDGESTDAQAARVKTAAVAALAALLGCAPADLARSAALRDIPENHTLAEVSDASDGVLSNLVFVVSGICKEMSLSDGIGDVVFGKSLHPGQLASQGLTSVLSDEPPMASVCACTDAVVLLVPTAELGRLIEQVPRVLAKVVQLFLGSVHPLLREFDFAMSSLMLEDGVELFAQGDANDFVYIVLSGRVRSVHFNQNTGSSSIVAEYGKLDVIGDLDLSGTGIRSTSVHVQGLRHHFWTISGGHLGSLPPHTPTHAVYCALFGYHAYWMLIGACNPML